MTDERPPSLPELLTVATGFYIAMQFKSAFVGACAMWAYLIAVIVLDLLPDARHGAATPPAEEGR